MYIHIYILYIYLIYILHNGYKIDQGKIFFWSHCPMFFSIYLILQDLPSISANLPSDICLNQKNYHFCFEFFHSRIFIKGNWNAVEGEG